jgi:hypothetical protein
LLGIKIDRSDKSQNTFDSIRGNCEFDSNAMDQSDLQNEKLDKRGISTLLAILTSNDCQRLRIKL